MTTWGNIFLVISVASLYLAGHVLLQWTPSYSIMSVIGLIVREREVFDTLLNLDTTSVSGPDGVSAQLLKEAAPSICLSLRSLSVMCMAVACAGVDIWRLQPAESHTFKSIFAHYMLIRVIAITFGWYGARKFPSLVKMCLETQEELLFGILQRASKSKYGKLLDFSSIKSVAEYQKRQILTSYEHFRPYVDEMLAGEQNVLFCDKPVWFGTTSGTTGRDKLIPLTRRAQQKAAPYFMIEMRRNLVHMPRLGRVLRLSVRTRPRAAGCGVSIGPISNMGPPSVWYDITPPVFGTIYHEPTVLYIHAVFSLAEEDITWFDSLTAQLAYSFFRLVEENWQNLCDDIEAGKISESLELKDNDRKKINMAFKADVFRAAKLRSEFKRGFKGIAKRVWPNLNFVTSLTTGAFENYAKMLFSNYLAGVHYWSPTYMCTEGFIATGLSEEGKIGQYLIHPHSVFFEFIPEQDVDVNQPVTLLLHQLSVGCSYEVVMTTMSGLYRYRLGDVIKVVDFMEQCPIVEYQYRLGSMLNLSQDFTSEKLLYTAISKAENKWDGVIVVDYTATDSLALQTLGLRQKIQDRQHYVVFLEVSRKGQDCALSEENKAAIEDNLRAGHEGYDKFRVGKLGAMEVIQVPIGTFKQVKAVLTRRSPNQQFKMPRVLKKKEGIELLLDAGAHYARAPVEGQ